MKTKILSLIIITLMCISIIGCSNGTDIGIVDVDGTWCRYHDADVKVDGQCVGNAIRDIDKKKLYLNETSYNKTIDIDIHALYGCKGEMKPLHHHFTVYHYLGGDINLYQHLYYQVAKCYFKTTLSYEFKQDGWIIAQGTTIDNIIIDEE